MKKEQFVNELMKMRSQIDDLLKELSYEDSKTFKEMPISNRLLYVLKDMGLDYATPIEFATEVNRSDFKKSKNVGTKTFKEMIDIMSKVGLDW